MVSEKNIGANQFEDVSLEPQFSSLIGFTEAELRENYIVKKNMSKLS